jgi:hypothetical protein
MSNEPAVPTGRYRHYKGKEYLVIGIGRDSETEGEVVIYQPLYASDVAYWVRPLRMFTETVNVNGNEVKRFEKIGENHG